MKASRNEHGLLQAVICFENNNMKGQTSDGGSNENIHKGTVQVAAQYKLLKTERESMNKLHKNRGTLTRFDAHVSSIATIVKFRYYCIIYI